MRLISISSLEQQKIQSNKNDQYDNIKDKPEIKKIKEMFDAQIDKDQIKQLKNRGGYNGLINEMPKICTAIRKFSKNLIRSLLVRKGNHHIKSITIDDSQKLHLQTLKILLLKQ